MAFGCGACLQPPEKAANSRKTAETLRIENIVREPRNVAALLFIVGGMRHLRHKHAWKRSERGTMPCDIHERTWRGAPNIFCNVVRHGRRFCRAKEFIVGRIMIQLKGEIPGGREGNQRVVRADKVRNRRLSSADGCGVPSG